jgi:hypothetical protein
VGEEGSLLRILVPSGHGLQAALITIILFFKKKRKRKKKLSIETS